MSGSSIHDDDSRNRVLSKSIWLLYVLIVLEILFMVSPFALYYYSAYGLPLNWLAESTGFSWLVQHILPHFTYHTNFVARVLIATSWPLMLAGILMFVVGFTQIYWAKFTGKGAITVGLYKYIRHPQYLALALIGLGATLYWSRFLILISYIAMLFLYFWLAKLEEERCLRAYGQPYANYLKSTGRFFPRLRYAIGTGKLPISWPSKFKMSAFFAIAAWLAASGIAVTTGFLLKQSVVNSMLTIANDDTVLVSLAPVEDLSRYWSIAHSDAMIRATNEDQNLERTIIYLVPASWSVPELGLSPEINLEVSNRTELLRPAVHGNSLEFDDRYMRMLFARTEVARKGRDILFNTVAITPLFLVHLEDSVVTSIDTQPRIGPWDGIPVPIY